MAHVGINNRRQRRKLRRSGSSPGDRPARREAMDRRGMGWRRRKGSWGEGCHHATYAVRHNGDGKAEYDAVHLVPLSTSIHSHSYHFISFSWPAISTTNFLFSLFHCDFYISQLRTLAIYNIPHRCIAKRQTIATIYNLQALFLDLHYDFWAFLLVLKGVWTEMDNNDEIPSGPSTPGSTPGGPLFGFRSERSTGNGVGTKKSPLKNCKCFGGGHGKEWTLEDGPSPKVSCSLPTPPVSLTRKVYHTHI